MKKSFKCAVSFILFLFVFAVFAVSAFADAAAATVQQTGFSNLIDNTIQPIALSILGMAITLAITYITGLLKKKLGMDISNATNDRLRIIAFDAVAAVEEQAAKTLKEKGQKWASENKHSAAIDMICSQVPTVTKDQADNLINSALGLFKGIGASGETGATQA